MEQQEIKKKNQKFQPQTAPLYLGLFAKDQAFAQQTVLNYVQENLQKLAEHFPEKAQQINQEVEQLQIKGQGMNFPQSQHITSFFAGGKLSEEPYFTQFQENIEQEIEICAIAYVPNHIICGVAVVDQEILLVKNICPHLTMFTQKWAPVYSNILLESLFTENGPLQQQFESKQLVSDEKEIIQYFQDLDIKNENTKKDTYFIKIGKSIKIPGITKAFYTQQTKKKGQNNNYKKK